MPIQDKVSFGSTYSGLNYGANAVGFGRNAIAGTDQFIQAEEARQAELQRIATNQAISKAMQSGQSLEQIQASNPELFASFGKNVDASKLFELQNTRANTASDLLVDASGVRANDSAANFNDIRAGLAPAESEANVKRMLAAAGASEAEITAYQNEEKERQRLRKEEERKRTGFAGINQFLDGGEFDQQIESDFATFVKENKLNEDDANAIKNNWVSDHRADLMADPRFLNTLFLKNNVTPLEATEGTQVGQMSNFTQQALITAQAELATRQTEAASKTIESMRQFANGKAAEFDYRNGEVVYGKPAQTMNQDSAKIFARDRGLDVDDDETMEVIDSIRTNFPGSGAFEQVLSDLRPEGASTLDRASIAEVIDRRKALEQNAAFEVSQYDNPVRQGGSASENALNYLEAKDSFKARQAAIPKDGDTTTSAPEVGFKLPVEKPTTVQEQVTSITTSLRNAEASIESLSAESKQNLRIPLNKLRNDMDQLTNPKTSYAKKKAYANQIHNKLTRILEAEAKKVQKEEAANRKRNAKTASETETNELNAALQNALSGQQ